MRRAGTMPPRAMNKVERPIQRKKLLFESLEPRLLLSADLAPEIANTLSSGVNQFKDWAANLSTYQQLGQQLPVVNTALGTATDLSGWLQTKIVDPVQTYLAGGGAKTTDGLVSALAGVAGLSAVSGDQYGNEVRLNTVLDASRTLNDLNMTSLSPPTAWPSPLPAVPLIWPPVCISTLPSGWI